MKKAIRPIWALFSLGIQKQKPKTGQTNTLNVRNIDLPAARRVQHMLGKVKSKRPRRPNVSIVHTAGQAKVKLTKPNPKDARRACFSLKPPCLKIVEE